MVMQSPLVWEKDESTILCFAGILLPRNDYSTVVTNFPGTNCVSEFDTKGKFYIDFSVYHEGKKRFEVSTEHTTESGCISFCFDDIISPEDGCIEGIVIAHYWHSKEIPVELYLSYVHRQSGAYLSYPASAFMGDDIYTGAHSQEMENAQFWPGLELSDTSEHSIVVVNPYEVPYMYQLSLYVGASLVARAKPLKAKPFRKQIHVLEEVFADHLDEIRNSRGCASVCVSGQFKVLANMMIRHKETNFITTLDHLHRYCMI
jgi:hypothetical protein